MHMVFISVGSAIIRVASLKIMASINTNLLNKQVHADDVSEHVRADDVSIPWLHDTRLWLLLAPHST